MRAADRDRAGFLAAVSHELRSPLNAILGFADILMTEVDGPLTLEAREEVEQIRGSGKHLLDLINDILEFSALESGQLKLSRSRVDLAALAWEVVREAAGLVGARPVVVRIEGEEGVLARADPRRVRQVLTNLVGNAIKFTQHGEVVVDVGREGRFARVSVRDTGPGISAQERAVIFEEYKQSKEERTRRRGTGLGLAIARRLVLDARREDRGRQRGGPGLDLQGHASGVGRRQQLQPEEPGEETVMAASHRLIPQLLAIQLVAWASTGLLVVAFAPRLLLLDPAVVEGSKALALGGWLVTLAVVLGATLLVVRPVRPLIQALAVGAKRVDPGAGIRPLRDSRAPGGARPDRHAGRRRGDAR